MISTIPFVMSQAGESGLVAALTIGEYTYIMNGLLVLLQILILRKKFELVQSLQLVIGFVFGYFLDLNMSVTSMFDYSTIWSHLAYRWNSVAVR